MAAELQRRGGRSRLQESECRRQQLEAYLSRKGKLKNPGPNARYYLGDRTNRKVQPATAPFKVGLAGNLKAGSTAKPPQYKSTSHLTSSNHVNSVAARSKTQSNRKTSEAKKTLSKTLAAFSQGRITSDKASTLFPVESNTAENVTTADRTVLSELCEGGLNPATCAKNVPNVDFQEKGRERMVDTAPKATHSTDAAFTKPYVEQAIKTQVCTSKDIASYNPIWSIGVVRTAMAAPSAAKPAGAVRTAPSAAKPAGAVRTAPSAAKPAGKAMTAQGTAKPVNTVMVQKQSIDAGTEKNDDYKQLSKSARQVASAKTKPETELPLQNVMNPTGNQPVIIWQPFTRSAQKTHPALWSAPSSIKGSKGAVQSASKLTTSVISTAKRRGNESTVSKTAKGQDERRKLLEEWLASKGKTYKRPPMPTPFKKLVQSVKKNLELSFWDAIEEEEEQKSLTARVTHMLDDCMQLLEKGSLPEQVSAALQAVPDGEKFAKYWICQARLLEITGPMEAVIALFEQAVHSGAEPVEELRSALVETLMRNANTQPACAENDNETGGSETDEFRESVATVTTHTTAMRVLCEKADGHGSSVVKYRVTATPQVHRGKETADRIRSVGKQDVKFLTPVRRSVRIEHASASYPEMLKEHDCCVTSLNELLAVEETETFVYQENQALLKE